MNFYEVIQIVLVLIKLTFAGSDSYCGQLESAFTVLYQAIIAIIDISEASSTDSALENSFAFSLECKLNQSIVLIADGTSRLTEIDSSYIVDILNGVDDRLFQSPLDCIHDGLIAVRFIVNFTRNVAVPKLKSEFVPSSIPGFFNCATIQEHSRPKFEFFASEIQEKIADFSGLATSFNDINMLDLFINFLSNHQTCTIDSLAYVAAGSVNGNENEALAYLLGLRTLSFPLNCTKINIDEYSNQITTSYMNLLEKITHPEHSSMPPTCELLSNVVIGLKATIFGMFSRIQNQTLHNALEHPELITGYVTNVRCKVDMILLTIAKRLDKISSIPWTDILVILQGHMSLSLVEPLSCIQDDLVQISHRAEYVTGDFIMFLESTVLSRLELLESCEQVESIIGNLTDSVHSFIRGSIDELKLENEDFSGLNNGYEYISTIMSQECEKKSLATIYSSVLEGDFDIVMNIMNAGEAFDFPYNCVTSSILDSIVYARELIFEAGLYFL